MRNEPRTKKVRVARHPPLPLSLIKKIIEDTQKSSSLLQWRTGWRMVLGFFGLLRFSEISRLQRKNIFFSYDGLEIFISGSKTDQRKAGKTVFIASNTTDPRFCPVLFTQRYFEKAEISQDDDYLQAKFLGKTVTQRCN